MKDATPDRSSAADGELVRQTVRGDRRAFDVLVGRHQRRAMQVAYGLLGNVDDALEVTQEAFLRAFRKLDSLAAPAKFGSWLLRIVSNQSLNYRRGRALRKTASLEHPSTAGDREDQPVERNLPDRKGASPSETASANELRAELRRAIDQLPETQRSALVLFSIQKLPQKEVAEILNLSVEAVKWHVFTARKKLKGKFSEYL